MSAAETQSVIFEKVAVVGIGLIGSSILHAASHKAAAKRLASFDGDEGVRAKARDLKLPGDVCETLEEAVSDADLVVLAIPVGAMAKAVSALAPFLKAGSIITDTGSTKRSVISDVAGLVPEHAAFIPGHPLAGTEFSGPAAGFPALFEDRYWLLLPEQAEAAQVDRLDVFCQRLGAITERMDADYHDRVLALTSHLPHLIAYTIVGTAVDLEGALKNDVIRFSASGFRDFTRIAASDPTMWRDVFLNNHEAVLEMLQRFTEDLSYLQRAIRWQEGDKLFELFSRTRDIRRSILDAGQDQNWER